MGRTESARLVNPWMLLKGVRPCPLNYLYTSALFKILKRNSVSSKDTVYLDHDDLVGATEMFRKVLVLKITTRGELHEGVGCICNIMARLMMQQSDLERSMAMHERTTAIKKAKRGKIHNSTGDTDHAIVALSKHLSDRAQTPSYTSRPRQLQPGPRVNGRCKAAGIQE